MRTWGFFYPLLFDSTLRPSIHIVGLSCLATVLRQYYVEIGQRWSSVKLVSGDGITATTRTLCQITIIPSPGSASQSSRLSGGKSWASNDPCDRSGRWWLAFAQCALPKHLSGPHQSSCVTPYIIIATWSYPSLSPNYNAIRVGLHVLDIKSNHDLQESFLIRKLMRAQKSSRYSSRVAMVRSWPYTTILWSSCCTACNKSTASCR